MNAYELADDLWEKYLDNNECQHGYALSNGCPNDNCKEQALYDSATMLRQQADRIAELEDKLSFYELKDLDTHPVKQLSDERIMEISGGENLSEQVFFWNKDMVLAFARAIIKEITE